MEFASKEEKYFYWWLEELIKHKLVTSFIYQPKPFILSETINLSYKKALATKTKIINVALLQPHEYQADFMFFWNPKVLKITGKMYVYLNEVLLTSFKQYPFIANYSKKKDCFYSLIDVKGTYNQNDAWRRFSIEQKWVYQNFNIYVQKIITHPHVTKKGDLIPKNALFPNTFVPDRFLTTDKSKKKRKIRYSSASIKEYLKNL